MAVQNLWNTRLQELMELGKHKKLKPIEDDYLRGSIALIIANQTQYNNLHGLPHFVKQMSIPTSVHIVSAIPPMFGLQVFKGPDTDMHFYFEKAGDVNSMVALPYKPALQPNVIVKNMDDDPLDPENIAYQCVEMAVTMVDDIIRAGVDDMTDNAAAHITSELYSIEGVLAVIKQASDAVKEAIGRPANFIVLPAGVARYIKSELVTEYDFDALPINIRRVGCLKNKWIVYINAYDPRQILVGYRGTHPADAGYIVSPALHFCEPKKEPPDRIKLHRKSLNALVRNDYFACIELTADKRSDSIEEF
jgi:hypothetical protein